MAQFLQGSHDNKGSSVKPTAGAGGTGPCDVGWVMCPHAAVSISNPIPPQTSSLCHLIASLSNEGLKK